jgi:hypothetical protein
VQYDQEFQATYDIDRSDSLHTETNRNTGTSQVSKIIWTGDCEYDLYKIVSDGLNPLSDAARQGKPYHNRMTYTAEDFYVFETWVDGIPLLYSDTVFRAR